MGLYSATAVIPATGVLYALTLAATRGEQVSRELAILSWRELALPSFRMLTPLYGVFGLLIWLAIMVGPTMPVVTTLATLACLLWYLCATYWGPMLAVDPGADVVSVARGSLRLVWRYPAETFVTGLVAAVALVVGMVSIGGLVLIVPVVIALLHTQRYLDLMAREGAATLEGVRRCQDCRSIASARSSPATRLSTTSASRSPMRSSSYSWGRRAAARRRSCA